MKKFKFKTPNEMVNWLIEHECSELADEYGRRWKYENFDFYFKDIGSDDEYEKSIEGIKCLHLYSTNIHAII